MDQDEFEEKALDVLNNYTVKLDIINAWYKPIVNTLKEIKEQTKAINHNTHLGNYLENELASVFRNLLPQRYQIEKGFLLNHFSAVSQEQDLLIIDTALGSPICNLGGSGYYPAESVMGAIEVKSNLNTSELRKCFISCMSAKKLYFSPFDYNQSEKKTFFYAIFAYTSSGNIEETLAQCLEKTPEPLRPNLIYILDKGLYLPTSNGEGLINLAPIQQVNEGYLLQPNGSNKDNSSGEDNEAQNFTHFFSLLIEHAFHQSSIRQPTPYSKYITTPDNWNRRFKEKGHEEVKNIPNKYFRIKKQEEGKFRLIQTSIAIFKNKFQCCDNAKKTAIEFYTIPPATKKTQDIMHAKLQQKGYLPLPEKKFSCNYCKQESDVSKNNVRYQPFFSFKLKIKPKKTKP